MKELIIRNVEYRALIEYVKNEFRSKNLNKMILWCLKENYSSRKFYESMGGKLCGESSYVRGNKEDKEVGFIYDFNE